MRNIANLRRCEVHCAFHYIFRFQAQTDLHKSKPTDFRMAIEEALLAEQGFMDGQLGMVTSTVYDANPHGFHEATGSNHLQDCSSQCQACTLNIFCVHFGRCFKFEKVLNVDVIAYGAI